MCPNLHPILGRPANRTQYRVRNNRNVGSNAAVLVAVVALVVEDRERMPDTISRKATQSPTLKPMMAFSLKLEREEQARDCETWAREGEVRVREGDVRESEVVVVL